MKNKIPSNVMDDSNSIVDRNDLESDGVASDAVLALLGLGLNRAEAQNLVQGVIAKNPDVSIDQLITLALKMRGSNV